jgi:hypothetical protein
MKRVPLPSDLTSPILLADWLEILALNSADGNASHADLQRSLNRLGAHNADELCIGAMTELNKRTVATGDNYPFTFSGTLLSLRGDWQEFTPYIFCLLLSVCENKKKRVAGINHEMMFEQLSCIAASNYIGGKALRFGAPRDELPAAFGDALLRVCAEVNEWGFPSGKKFLHRKDDGLDLVAWKPFPDRQIGKLVLFGHCASGQDWGDKINELRPDVFCSRWLGGDKSPVVKTFFIPHRVSSEMWDFHAIAAKLFFDRCRIAYWVKSEDFSKATKRTNVRWCKRIFETVWK